MRYHLQSLLRQSPHRTLMLSSREGIAQVAQKPLVLALLPVSLLLRLLGLGLLLAGSLLLGCLFPGSALPLLGAALSLFLLVAGYRASGFLHLTLGFLFHYRPPTTRRLARWPL